MGARGEDKKRYWLLRLLVFFAVLLTSYILVQVGSAAAVRHLHIANPDWIGLAASLVSGALMVVVYVALVRGMEQRSARELSPRIAFAIAGIVLGVAAFAAVFVLLQLAGVARWHGINAHFNPLPMLAAALLAAVGEELAFRGALFRILEESLGSSIALAISAVIFGLLHAANPGATAVSTAAIALEAGVLLSASYALTRNLWFPIGLHLGWNFTEGGLFGASVSGGTASKGLFAVALQGPQLLTGGRFGPEASIIAVALSLIVSLVMITLAVRARRWLGTAWRAANAA